MGHRQLDKPRYFYDWRNRFWVLRGMLPRSPHPILYPKGWVLHPANDPPRDIMYKHRPHYRVMLGDQHVCDI